MNTLAFVLLLWSAPACAAPVTWSEDLKGSLAKAGEEHGLVLVDFSAPWCYSCYYMEHNVLNQPELRKLSGRMEPVRVDVDTAEGLNLKKELNVVYLPTYVILDPQSREVDRIVGEQSRAEFYSQLDSVMARSASPKPVDIVRETFKMQNLPGGLRAKLEADKSRAAALRVRLQEAKAAKDAATCATVGKELLSIDTGCAYSYDAEGVNDCVQGLPEKDKADIRGLELSRLKPILEKHIFGSPRRRCSDFRSPVETAAEIYEAAGRKEEAKALLDRTIRLLRGELKGNLRSDRSKADNLRAFLDMADRDDELESLFPRLIAAYPDDYVYSYRFAKFLLLKRGRPDDALKQVDASFPKTYGINRVRAREIRAQALAKLGRKKEAADDLDAAMKEASGKFPDEAAVVKGLQAQIAP